MSVKYHVTPNLHLILQACRLLLAALIDTALFSEATDTPIFLSILTRNF